MSAGAPVFYPGDPVCDALFSGRRASSAQVREFREEPIEFINGHFSNSWPDMMMKKAVAREATRRCPANVDELGRVHGNGIRSNFYGLQHVNGFGQIPATFPLADNRLLREKEGLVNHFTEDWHRVALRSLVSVLFEGLEPVPLRLRKGSSSMAPFYENRMPKKKEIASQALKTAQQSAKWMSEGNFERAWLENQCGGAYHTVYRRQSSDAVDLVNGVWVAKERKVADLEFAVTGGRHGRWEAASKELGDVGFRVPEGFFRERKRTAMGGPLGMNAPLMPIAQSARARIYDEYAYTYHHTTREAIQTDLREWSFAIAADVTQHDQFWPTFILDTICEGMSDAGVQEWWLQLYKTKSHLPLYVTDVGPGLGNLLIGDWRKPDLHVGLPSGNALTDLEGTILMTWVYFLIQVTHTYPTLARSFQKMDTARHVWRLYLKGKLPIVLKDKSDDALLGWTDEALLPAANALLDRMKAGDLISPYMKVSYEHGGAFLGNILLYPENKRAGGLVLVGNGVSLLVNQLSPEYGVQSGVKDRSRTKRPFPGLAWESLASVYGSAPAYGTLMEILERAWFDHFHESYRGFRERLLQEDQQRLLHYVEQLSIQVDIPNLTNADKEVLADAEKAQYKFTPEMLTKGVVDLLFQGLSLDEVEPYFRSAYNG